MTVEAEIQARIERIGESFGHLDLSAWFDCFHTPFSIVMANEVVCLHSLKETLSCMQPMLENLRQRGFTGTELVNCEVKQLSPVTAIASTVWHRYAGTELLESLGATYLFMLKDESWKAILVTSHSPDISVFSGTGCGT